MAETANVIWADGPASEAYEPEKSRIRAWGTWIESFLSAISSNGGFVYTTRAFLYLDLTKSDKTMAWVISDPTTAYNGIYQKNGAAGSGVWTRVADLPYSFIVANDVGAGTPNAIQATSSIPISESALIWFNVFEPNGPGPVTVSFNGSAPLTIKTNSGNDPVDQGLVGIVMGVKIGSTFRLVTDQASVAIQAAAEAAAAAAAGYAALARNDVVINPFTGNGSTTDFTLTVDPGSANNIRVNMNGASQLHSSYSLVYVSTVPTLRFSEAPPNGVAFEAEMGFRIAVGTPADASIITAKLADDSVTYAKMQNISATLRLLGRKTAGAGDAEEISAAELRDLFLPAGSVVQSVAATPYTANTSISSLIPVDNTIPQITEGTQILTVTITPQKSTSVLRLRFRGQASINAANGLAVASIHKVGQNDAIATTYGQIATSLQAFPLVIETDIVAGGTSPITFTVRVGHNNSPNSLAFNGAVGTALFGGASAATLVVEEIKA